MIANENHIIGQSNCSLMRAACLHTHTHTQWTKSRPFVIAAYVTSQKHLSFQGPPNQQTAEPTNHNTPNPNLQSSKHSGKLDLLTQCWLMATMPTTINTAGNTHCWWQATVLKPIKWELCKRSKSLYQTIPRQKKCTGRNMWWGIYV